MESNGKSNAATGEMIKPVKVGRIFNDVVAPAGSKPASPKPAAATIKTPIATKSLKPDVKPPKHAAPHKPQKAQTLMRSAVKRPAPGLKRQTKVQTPTTLSAVQPVTGNTPSKHLAMDMARRNRAQGATKSNLITKFSKGSTSPKPTTPTQFATAAVNANAVPIIHNSPKRSMDVFERALAKANAHQQPAYDPKKQAKLDKKLARHASQPVHHKRWGRRFAAGTSVIAAVIILAGFIAYQNRTNLELHLASTKAGFSATIPGYHPVGYSLDNLQYGDGYVTMDFHSADANRTYKLNQQSTNWDSRTLLDNFVSNKNESYQTVQKAGRTIYLYGNNNASWVDSGVLYKVDSGNNLSTTDVLDIASSL